MKPFFMVVLSAALLFGTSSGADIVVFKNGSRSKVESVEITARAVHIITLNGKKWSVLRDAVDVEATVEANRALSRERKPPEKPSPVKPLPEKPTPEKPPDPQKPQPPPRPPLHVEQPAPTPRPPTRREPTPAVDPRSQREPISETKPQSHRFALYVNGAAGTSPLEFAETQSYELFKEEALVDHRYKDPKGRGLEIGGLMRVKGPFGVSAAVELFKSDREAAYAALLPHPFFYEQQRLLSGSRSDLTHEEQALHLGAVLSTSWGRRFSVDVFGGPSLFFTRTEVLGELLYSEIYPYDAVVPLGAESRVFEDRPWGYNVGASATLRVVSHVGLDIGIRFSRARIQLIPAENRAIEFDAGGLRASAGLRFLFP
jgi:hypothetical protein